jgi:NTE family protein
LSDRVLPAGESSATPKLGLALSGGGFRAAYFHIGVLARLAERGLLREVEVISTVSGGSIVGVLYYLHLKNLFETFERGSITPEHYVEIVADIEEHFDRAVRRNLRAGVFLNPFLNIAMAWPGYTRSHRIGALYERRLYRRVWRGEGPFQVPAGVLGARPESISMRDLLIRPEGHAGDFNPDRDNVAGLPQVPILLVNATTLNTGHGWRFEAMYMGELNVHREGAAPEEVNSLDPGRADVDKNRTVARTAYAEMEVRLGSQRLGTAVAASSGFPGLFAPYELPRFARAADSAKTWTVRLIDGGAHDNQGVAALIDRGCDRFILSDAGGQMKDIGRPVARLPSVVGRASSLARDRVRELQVSEAWSADRTAFMHLAKGLPASVLRPRAGDGGYPPEERLREEELPASAFGVHPQVQRLLAGIRTDLDSFSTIEAGSLECDGYRMSGEVVARARDVAALARHPAPERDWPFEALGDQLAQAPTGRYLRRLRGGRKTFLKAVDAGPPWLVPGVLLAALLAAVAYGIVLLWESGSRLNAAWLAIGGLAALVALAAYAASETPLLKLLGYVLYELLAPLGLGLVSLVAWPVAAPLSRLANRIFLWRGRWPP